MVRKITIFLLSSFIVIHSLLPSCGLQGNPPPASFLLSSLSNKGSPIWWEVKIVLFSEGKYRITEGKSSYPGYYSFTILWTGCMERDNGDFLLYRENFKILQWKAQETAILPDSLDVLSTNDFLDKPSLNLNYILKKENFLNFDFSVKGFFIPQNFSEYKFYLNLPVSEENSQPINEINYDSFVFQGSNRIFLREKEIYHNSVKKKFSWKWKYQKWTMDPKRYVFFTHNHDVEVEVSITPHFKKQQ